MSGLGLLSAFLVWGPCLPTWVVWGTALPVCQEGDLVPGLGVELFGIQRGGTGTVVVHPVAWWYRPDYRNVQMSRVGRASATVQLFGPGGGEIEIQSEELDDYNDDPAFQIRLPERLPDGEYTLRATARTPLGEITTEAPLSLYAPAAIDVLTDRPLYEPGNLLLLRVLGVRARDGVPLPGRPGRLTLTDPTGLTLLDEDLALDEWGVASSSFPLNADAPHGTWNLCWVSGEDTGCSTFLVEPFTLPRLSATATANQAAYLPGDSPRGELSVRYASGAPVANADLEFRWASEGEWAPPNEWLESLPKVGRTDSRGRFELQAPSVPSDLIGLATVRAFITATDPTGEATRTTLAFSLSEDPIRVDVVTELGGGLAEGFNNRVYLRTTDAGGRPLAGATIRVKRAWDPVDPGVEAVSDSDGVAALQLDPGPAVTVVIPQPPGRLPPPPPPVSKRSLLQFPTLQAASLADQRAIDELLPRLQSCALWAEGDSEDLAIDLWIEGGGSVRWVEPRATPLARCAAAALAGSRLPAGSTRLLRLELLFRDPGNPKITTEVASNPPHLGMVRAFADGAAAARACLRPDLEAGGPDRDLFWRIEAGERQVSLIDLSADRGTNWTPAETACVLGHLRSIRLDEPATTAAMGSLSLSNSAGARAQTQVQPAPRTQAGYALLVSAIVDGQNQGDTTLRLWPAPIPDRRMRVDTPVAKAGSTVHVELFRGPNSAVTLPKQIALHRPDGSGATIDLAEGARTASFTLPPDARGWYSVRWEEAVVRAYVPEERSLDLDITPAKTSARPGETIDLRIQTQEAGQNTAASVSLFGVDETLGQLVALPGTDHLARLRPPGPTGTRAFSTWEPAALRAGLVSGPNALQAIVLGTGDPPTPPPLDRMAHTQKSPELAWQPVIRERFFNIYARMRGEVRVWEQAAPPEERLTPAVNARLWAQAMRAAADAGDPTTDSFGRPLRLAGLPDDLLDLLDPRRMVRGTRLPEDLENWPTWVRQENP